MIKSWFFRIVRGWGRGLRAENVYPILAILAILTYFVHVGAFWWKHGHFGGTLSTQINVELWVP